jgi:hypothetical protein
MSKLQDTNVKHFSNNLDEALNFQERCESKQCLDVDTELGIRSNLRRCHGFLRAFINVTEIRASAFNMVTAASKSCFGDSDRIKSMSKAFHITKNQLQKMSKFLQNYVISPRSGIDWEHSENIVFALLSCHYNTSITLMKQLPNETFQIRSFCQPSGNANSECVIVKTKCGTYEGRFSGSPLHGTNTDKRLKLNRTVRRPPNAINHSTMHVSLHSFNNYGESGNLVVPFIDTFLSQCKVQ